MKYSSLESEYLVELIKAAINGTSVPQPSEQLDWGKLVANSKKQQVYSIIAVIMDALPLPEKEAQEIKLYNQNELLRIVAMKNEQEMLEKELEENGINFMPLKGSLLRKYYPKQRMRQMSDVDILYDSSKKKKLFEIMKQNGYSIISCSENSDDFTKPPFYTFEFHRELFFKEHDFYFDFSQVWENAFPSEENSCKYVMSNEDLYLHSIAHMYKHYVLGGFGIRFLADTYLMLKAEGNSLNRNYIDIKLKDMELSEFEGFIRELSLELFGNGDFTQEQIDFLNKSFKFGIYGNSKEGVKIYYDEYLKKNGGNGSVFGYYVSKMFPSFNFMKRAYPKLGKRPYLIPFFYFYRLINKVIFKRKTTIENFKTLRNYKKENKHGG